VEIIFAKIVSLQPVMNFKEMYRKKPALQIVCRFSNHFIGEYVHRTTTPGAFAFLLEFY